MNQLSPRTTRRCSVNLTDEQLVNLVNDLKANLPYAAISAKYGISVNTVFRINHLHKSWAPRLQALGLM